MTLAEIVHGRGHRHEPRRRVSHRRAQRFEAKLLVHADPFFERRNKDVRMRSRANVLKSGPQKAAKDDAAPAPRLDRQQAHFHGADAGRPQDVRFGQSMGDGKRWLIVKTNHADNSIPMAGDEVEVLFVKLIDEPAAPRVRVLWDFLHKRRVIQSMNLLELGSDVRSFEHIPAPAKQHGNSPRDNLATIGRHFFAEMSIEPRRHV
jgi:hypothetical protein